MNKRETNSNIIEQLCDEAYEIFHGEPDVIIFGEIHTYMEHTREQARSVIRNRPEYVLLEGLNDLEAEQNGFMLKVYKFMTVRELMAQLSIPLSLMKKKTVIENLRRETSELFGKYGFFGFQQEIEKLPNNLHDLFETPIYDLPIPAYFGLIEDLKECIEEVSRKVDASDLDPTSKSAYQKKLSAALHLITLWERSNLYELKGSPLYYATSKVSGNLAGCDISKKDIPKTVISVQQETSEEIGQKLGQLFDAQEEYLGDNNQLREKTMGERIVHFNKLRKTNRPNIAVLGKDHLRPQSGIHAILKANHVKYRCIKQRQKLFPSTEQKFKDETYGLELGMEMSVESDSK